MTSEIVNIFNKKWILFLFFFLICEGSAQTITWHSQSIGVNQLTTTIKAVTKDVVWLCGTQGVFYTTNGGINWLNSYPGSIQMIEAVNESTVIMTKELPTGTAIYLTSDYGKIWKTVYSNSTYINGIRMFDKTQGIAIGDPQDSVWMILRTTDGGNTWSNGSNSPKISSCESGNRNSVAVVDLKYAWFGVAGCGGHKIYKSTDGGISWKAFYTPFDDTYSIWFIDSLRGVAAFASGYFYSVDGGESWMWNAQIIPRAYNVSGTTKGILWGTSDSSIFSSTNAGATWNEKYRNTQTILGHLSTVVDNGVTYGWVAASNGSIVKFIETPASVDRKISKSINANRLSQNYPNPFNPSTRISYEIIKKSNVTLKVYDYLGNEVENLVSSVHEPGKYAVDFYAKKISSGVYFYRIVAGDYFETKKILFIK